MNKREWKCCTAWISTISARKGIETANYVNTQGMNGARIE